MPRQKSAEIDAEIVDRAAGLFARHGFANTSLQQVADEVGYTKAGLLYHFRNKQAIYDAVLGAMREQIVSLRGVAERVPAGAERDRALIAAMVELTYASPGIAAFATTLAGGDVIEKPELQEAALELLRMFGIDPEDVDEGRLVRFVSACAGLGIAAREAVRADRAREWRELIIETAMDTLGHGRRGADSAAGRPGSGGRATR